MREENWRCRKRQGCLRVGIIDGEDGREDFISMKKKMMMMMADGEALGQGVYDSRYPGEAIIYL